MSKPTVTTIEVKKTPQEAWAVFMDESNLAKWLTGFQKLETISGQPRTVGSKHKLTFLERGREMEFVEEVLVFKEAEEYTFRMDHTSMSIKTSVKFAARGDKTEITSTTEPTSMGLMWKLMMPLMAPSMKKRQRQDFIKLKQLIEASI